MIELRRNPILSEWIIINDNREVEHTIKSKKNDDEEKLCPFCAGKENLTPRAIMALDKNGNFAQDMKNWDIRVIPNNKPILAIESTLNRRADGVYDKMNGAGAHEIIIETPDHNKKIQDYSITELSRIFDVMQSRINDLKNDSRFEYILAFKNHGLEAGETLTHSHTQLVAMPIIPKVIKEEMNVSKKYYEFKERCLFCDIIDQEISSGARIVTETSNFVAFVPYASRYPFETWILPKEHGTDFCCINDKSKKDDLASILISVMKRLYKVLDNPSYNFVMHLLPLKTSFLPYYHWHIEIVPKITKFTGFELGTGMYVNPTIPEETAKFLREAE